MTDLAKLQADADAIAATSPAVRTFAQDVVSYLRGSAPGAGGGGGGGVTSPFWLTFADLGLQGKRADVVWDGKPLSFQPFLDSLDGTSKRFGGLPWGSKLPPDLTFGHTIRMNHSGTPDAPIELFPVNLPSDYRPGRSSGEPDIGGRVVYYGGVANIKWLWTKFDGIHHSTDANGNTSAATVGGRSIVYDGCVMRQSDPAIGTIGVSPVDSAPPYGPSASFKFRRGKIYDTGRWPVASNSSPGFFMHASYNQGQLVTYEDFWIWNASRAGILWRGAQHGLAQFGAIDRCGTAIIFGDVSSGAPASYNEVAKVIATHSLQAGHVDDYDAHFWNTGVGNTLHDSTLFGGAKGEMTPGFAQAVAIANLLHVDPKYRRGLLASEQGATAGKYDPSLIDLRPTAAEVVAAGHGARRMVPYS